MRELLEQIRYGRSFWNISSQCGWCVLIKCKNRRFQSLYSIIYVCTHMWYTNMADSNRCYPEVTLVQRVYSTATQLLGLSSLLLENNIAETYRISSNSSRPPNRPRPRIHRVRRLEASENLIHRALELSAQCGQLNVNVNFTILEGA